MTSYHALPFPNANFEPDATRPNLLPVPCRQWSASMLHLTTDDVLQAGNNINIVVTSPMNSGNHSQNGLCILPNPSPLSHRSSVDTASSTTQREQTMFDVLPSPVSPNDYGFSRSNDQRACSVRSHAPSDRSTSILSGSSIKERYIRPVFPYETQRYTQRTRLPKVKTNLTFPPINLDYSKPSPPDGWVRYAHPEGARYFYNEELRIYTDSEAYDPEILQQLLVDHVQLKASIATFENPFPATGEFVINVYRENKTHTELTADEGTEKLSSEYYCIDHATRLVFFLKESRADWMDAWCEARGVRSAFQLQIEMIAQYWFFVQLYPSAIELMEDMVRELRDIVLHLIGDSMTSPYSTACYPLDSLYKILTLTRELERNIGPGSHGSMCLLTRKMYIFNHSRFLNFHGESSARIERDFSVYGDQSLFRRTWLIKTLSFVLFSAPEVHLKNLQRMWVDGIMYMSVWKQSAELLHDEWRQSTIFAIVVLIANVAFLGIQSVDAEHNTYRSPAQISGYLSVVADVGSIILGLLLMRQYRTSKETTDGVQKFLTEQSYNRLGLEPLAILYSLPYGLFMWGVVAFLAAFAFTWFQDSNASTRILVGVSCCAVTIMIVWCIYVFWERRIVPDTTDRPLAYAEPNDPCEEVVDEANSLSKDSPQGYN